MTRLSTQLTARYVRAMASRFLAIAAILFPVGSATSQAVGSEATTGKRAVQGDELSYPPQLPGKQPFVSDTSDRFLAPASSLRSGIAVATAPPTVDFLFYPGQNYPGKPWSNWGDGCVAAGKYYSAIGDHYAIGRGEARYGSGAASVFEYDPATRRLRSLVHVTRLLDLPKGHYTPGKIHSRIDMGQDGWLYYATHRGSPKAANDVNHYRGDWILRTNPATGESEVVVQAPVAKHSIPASVLDPQRLIFYGATAAGPDADDQEIRFFAYDIRRGKLLYAGGDGPARYMMLARSTGRLYYVPGNTEGPVMRFDPAVDAPPVAIGQTIGVRAATEETGNGLVYTVSTGQRSADATIWQFDTRKEQATKVGTASVGSEAYVASLDVDPTGRFLYYVPGAHGGAPRDGSPLVQFEVATGAKKVIAFLHPFYQEKYGLALKGTYSTAVSADGARVFITWNISRGSRAWDCCGLTVVHIPPSER